MHRCACPARFPLPDTATSQVLPSRISFCYFSTWLCFTFGCRTFSTGLSTRSEEHTSELQSRLHLVCRLLLEKKKKSHQAYIRHLRSCTILSSEASTQSTHS